TFDDALAQNSIYPDVPYFPNHIWKVQRPNSELAWADGAEETEVNSVACRVVRGMQQAGSQLHYYMETHSALALPGEANQMVIHASTQSPDSIHSDAAQALGVPTTSIDVRVDRVGGGYGGKTTRSPYTSTAAAVAAAKHRRPVRLAMRRENDSAMIGHRHPLRGLYALAIGTG